MPAVAGCLLFPQLVMMYGSSNMITPICSQIQYQKCSLDSFCLKQLLLFQSEPLSGGTLTPNSVNGSNGMNGIAKDSDDGTFVTESMNVYPEHLHDKLDDMASRDNLEIDESEFESSEMDTADLPVDLTSQCQETVESYMKLVGEGSYNCEFGGNTATVVQQIPVTNDDSFSASNGPVPAINRPKLSNSTNAVYKRRGRPPGWRKQLAVAVELAG